MKKNEARKAYHVAMTAFKANPPQIDKDAHVSYSTSKGRTDYKHATLANVTNKINAALSEHGLSAAWQTEQDEKGIAVTCKITHVLGHSIVLGAQQWIDFPQAYILYDRFWRKAQKQRLFFTDGLNRELPNSGNSMKRPAFTHLFHKVRTPVYLCLRQWPLNVL